MKRLVVMLSLGLLFLSITPAEADDIPYMDLVKALRAKNYTDLALDYLSVLEKSGPEDLKAFIPLERANIRLDQASSEMDMGKRSNLYDTARGEFQAFAKGKVGHPLSALAKLDAARILALQGRSLQYRARSIAEPGAKKNEISRIHDNYYIQAMTELEGAGDEIDKQMKKDHPPKMAKALEAARNVCDLEMYSNLIDQATCYEDLNKPLEVRGKMIDKALSELKGLRGRDPKGASGALARAWRVKGYNEVDQTKEAKADFDDLLKEGDSAEQGKRLGRYFYLVLLVEGRNLTPVGLKAAEVPKEIKRVAEEWIKLYPSHLSTFEGNHVRLMLANQLAAEGKASKAGNKEALLNDALSLYQALDEAETEFSHDVRTNKLELMLARADTKFDPKDIPLIKSFQVAMQTSEVETLKIQKFDLEIYELERKKDPTEADKKKLADLKKTLGERKKAQVQMVQDLLSHALTLADAKTPAKDVHKAKSTLVYVLTVNDDLYRAAVMGEHFAMTTPDSSEAPKAAQYALQAYAQIISQAARDGLPKELIEADRVRFKRLVEYMEATWPTDTATDAARHHVGTQLYRDQNFREAERVLSRISAGYAPTSLVDARYWWAASAQKMQQDKIEDKEKEYYRKQAIKALRGVPDLTGDVPPEVAQVYITAKMQLGGILFEAKEFAELEKLADQLVKKIPTLKLDSEETKDNYKRTAEALVAYAKFGRANQELHDGNPVKALELADNVLPTITKQLNAGRKAEAAPRKRYDELIDKQKSLVAIMKDLDKKEQAELDELKDTIEHLSHSITRDAELYRGLSLVALRACVMIGNNARARVIMTQDLPNAMGTKNVDPQVYVQLVAQLKKQIDELRAKGDKPKLDKLILNFTNFLNAMSDELGKQSKPDPVLIFFVANAYSSLGVPELHVKAAELVGKIPEPKAEPPKKVEPQQEKMYHAARLMYAKELRLGKKYPESRKVIGEILTKDWGKGFEVRREEAFCWMDEEKYGAAAKSWNDIIQTFGAKPDFSNARIKENYFESRYQYIYCLYMYAKNLTDPKLLPKKPDYIKRAATLIVQLENAPPGDMGGEAFKKRYTDLLNKEDGLKKEYDAVKKEKEKEKEKPKEKAAGT
ncbi:MAG: hypothetical protein K2R98_30415 [Gemmataceae bacterium]|nr:hypothetical protein [Gemmataceae bacterium]